ncbi:SDR family NAD(P)-dependent oxidoreductase [Ramlibacter sp. WS9]|uniref:SDR family NAD(P)-dependent oxidoreductase n=1 Tax=Ramlibacter sp. WS9 TaxID=1882741 RepID=UPI0013052503|nr:SDR family NAD(P)-dependent oxidoreductase [Ramlibacter sp. WS9]
MTTTFNNQSTTDDVTAGVDLQGKTILITGANSGLGQEAARALAACGARIVMGVRSVERGRAAVDAIQARHPAAQIELHELDLGSLASVRGFTDAVKAGHTKLDGLIANAGIMATDFGHTSDGFELQLGTNHLAHFVLVNRLAPLLLAGAPARVVMMSSGAHRLHDVDLDDPNFERKAYDRWDAYGQSKSANALFALGFDRRFGAFGVHAYTVAPGVILGTNLHHHLNEEHFKVLRSRQPGVRDLPRKTLAQGAATMVWAMTHPALATEGGRFLEDCGFSEVNPDPVMPNGVIPWVLDSEHADAVWALSERLVGETFAAPPSTGAPSAAAVASGLSVNRLPSTRALAGKVWKLVLQDGASAQLQFDAQGNGCRWQGLPGLTLPAQGTATADVVEAAPGVFFVDLMLEPPQETVAVCADTRSGQALVVASRMGERERPGATRFRQRFTAAMLGGAAAEAPTSAPTMDLIGRRALYRYSDDTVYEHVYLNSNWYAYQSLKGMRRGDAGCDEASYFKLADDLYVVAWRELLIDIAAVFVYDMKAMRTTGKAWGIVGASTEIRNIPAGAFIEPLASTVYPGDVLPV